MKLIRIPEFPNSIIEPFSVTSPHTPEYNCIAWAFGDNTKWYWPDPANTYYWPEDIPREINIKTFIQLFKSIGYAICKDGDLEEEFDKIAIFVDASNTPTHAARQLNNGFWTSKLGQHIDVQHTINSIEEGAYGMVSTFMKRPKVERPVGNNVYKK